MVKEKASADCSTMNTMNQRETAESTVKTEEMYRIKHANINVYFLNLFSNMWILPNISAYKADLDASYYLDKSMYHDSFSKKHQL